MVFTARQVLAGFDVSAREKVQTKRLYERVKRSRVQTEAGRRNKEKMRKRGDRKSGIHLEIMRIFLVSTCSRLLVEEKR